MQSVEQTLSEHSTHEFAGCIIDAQGREVPITEQMILHACQELDTHATHVAQASYTPAND